MEYGVTPGRRSRSGSAGFSLAEMLVVTVLMGAVMGALAVLSDALTRDRGRVLRDCMARNQADYARRRILADLEEATVLETPAAPTVSAGTEGRELIGFTNLRTDNLTAFSPVNCSGTPPDCFESMTPGASIFFRYCISTDKKLYRYGRSTDDEWIFRYAPNSEVVCGLVRGAEAPELIAGLPDSDLIEVWGVTETGNAFFRPIGTANYIDIKLQIRIKDLVAANATFAMVETGGSFMAGTVAPTAP